MLTVLSPAKKLNEPPGRPKPVFSQSELLDDTALLMETARGLSVGDLKSLMHISDALAELNHERFQSFEMPFTLDNAQQAAFTFAGDTYRGLNASTLSAEDLEHAQDHLAILSGLYGLLRPLDLMQPYRLEMGTKLQNPRGKNLYAFWKASVTERINALTEGHADRTLVVCASNEYVSAVDTKALAGPVVTPVFKERKDGKERVISFMAKAARGSMARWIIKKRVDTAEDIKEFSVGGYRFKPSASTETSWVFSRKQPPPVNG
ncbi:MAG: peroxide stress protein YaaA [Proteobacteria bacterium]|nr:peroxide stress protein YaaA [Pseudomonadota bacterium]MCP4917154.1 peroxide stress protein YaaA [Pseudomonadota bacterium]